MGSPLPEIKEPLAKLLNQEEIVIPGKRSATRNPGFLIESGFRLPPERRMKCLLQEPQNLRGNKKQGKRLITLSIQAFFFPEFTQEAL